MTPKRARSLIDLSAADRIVAFAILGLMSATMTLAGGSSIFLGTTSDSELVYFDLAQPDVLQVIGRIQLSPDRLPRGVPAGACDDDGAGRLLCYETALTSDFFAVDPSGATETLGVFSAGQSTFSGMAKGPALPDLYAVGGIVDQSDLWTIDPADGDATRIDDLTRPGSSIVVVRSIAFGASGTLYGVEAFNQTLVTIDPMTAVTTDVGPLTINPSSRGILDFDPRDGTCRYLDLPLNQAPILYSCDPTTGAMTFVATIGSTTPGDASLQISAGSFLDDSPFVFVDGFESGTTSAWSSVP